jgi:hypothetical protein
MLAITTVLSTGLVSLPGLVQEAQANPCSAIRPSSAIPGGGTGDRDIECLFSGDTKMTEPPPPPTAVLEP